MKLEDRIYNVEYYVKKFNSWEVKEIIIDDQKAFWEIRKPGSQIQKVSLFRDGSNMYIYGDYGSYSFDKMTWLGSPYNLEYNNLSYQNEKMSYDTKNNVYISVPYCCVIPVPQSVLSMLSFCCKDWRRCRFAWNVMWRMP